MGDYGVRRLFFKNFYKFFFSRIFDLFVKIRLSFFLEPELVEAVVTSPSIAELDYFTENIRILEWILAAVIIGDDARDDVAINLLDPRVHHGAGI
ncbi:MAG: hypothetical protein DI596_11635 [Azospira oryzae]|nr:MAG: hypothetical protein DI596_11635 [Azospira oryzae]PZP77834.1 MAG: hypothetical protein DI593_11635 [Azospira oryzae]